MANANSSVLTPSFSLFKKSKEVVLANKNTYGILLLLPFLLGLFTNIRAKDLTMFERMTSSGTGLGFSGAGLGLGAFVGLVVLVLSVITSLLIYFLNLDASEGKTPTLSQLWQALQKYGVRLFFLNIVLGLLIVFGFLALIVPGVIFLSRYLLAPYAMIDKDLSIGDAMTESARISKGYAGSIWGLIGVSIVLSLPGIIPVFGWVISFVLTSLYSAAIAYRYRELKALSHSPAKTDVTAAPAV